ncbi:YicC family protein [Verrucomicrobiales bacterium]|nr:YicC family protein [Verrucomicrobiales bacterium]MDB4737371.1 YicC family protein [Verrucomicrobiales bacterium]|tara:strand:- start:9415 stop:10290 length:876 start_codon:yes stop_codon:yes gene_type:complete
MKSMTGFGCGEASNDDLIYRVEVASVNRKQADIVVNLPRELSALDSRIRKQVSEVVSRGRINVGISLKSSEAKGGSLSINLPLAEEYSAAIAKLEEHLGLNGLVSKFDPSRAPGVIQLGETLPEAEDAWLFVEKALKESLSKLLEMRSTEGAHLKSDLESRLAILKGFLQQIAEQAPSVVKRHRENLIKRLDAAGIELNLDDERLIKEIGLFADRCDISEEVTRLESHFAQCHKYFKSDEAVGRPLDFLIQEMGREINTIGSKANDASIAQIIVESKTELEKIREQIQNIE